MSKDTNPEIDNFYYKLMMAKTPIERLKYGFSMFETAKKLVLSSIIDKENPRVELFLRFYENDFDESTKLKIITRIKSEI
jgi:hypothetical protein